MAGGGQTRGIGQVVDFAKLRARWDGVRIRARLMRDCAEQDSSGLRSTVARRLFTSESVTEGHPDKIADQISDGILDALLTQDPRSRVAVETLITTGQGHVAGEVTTKAYADIPSIVRDTILRIGYDSSKKGLHGASCGVSVSIGSQSPDIAEGVDSAVELREGSSESALDAQGAGHQGMMFGFACSE